jgi:hypothetical protein
LYLLFRLKKHTGRYHLRVSVSEIFLHERIISPITKYQFICIIIIIIIYYYYSVPMFLFILLFSLIIFIPYSLLSAHRFFSHTLHVFSKSFTPFIRLHFIALVLICLAPSDVHKTANRILEFQRQEPVTAIQYGAKNEIWMWKQNTDFGPKGHFIVWYLTPYSHLPSQILTPSLRSSLIFSYQHLLQPPGMWTPPAVQRDLTAQQIELSPLWSLFCMLYIIYTHAWFLSYGVFCVQIRLRPNRGIAWKLMFKSSWGR